ncbi:MULTISPECIES: polysaccharide pyruvyl transferase family protein [unclassified Methylophaga]|jgi:succinoglycan biosynthesis protein ExoV|uniref:polysaccharide pyruvyl transferase family protein n=1 Tax=unclassified Methylophaga TaxID=2629249 RepID=UPI00259CECC1|nr:MULTISPECIES: polysaccharide pyruvyl transferase family protein [unclassified Methylophaga]|tara:strand:- start:9957 stop:10796 length:840 start_codon:yes stop_codon:yes gene_type:complete
MKLFHYTECANFGDAINPWFWSNYIDAPFNDDCDQLFVGIGTLINDKLPLSNYNSINIMGSGAGYGESIPQPTKSWTIHCVRGPLTAKALGVEQKLAIADPAILISDILGLDNIGDKRTMRVGFMPHHSIDSPRLKKVVEATGVSYISPLGQAMSVISQVNSCERLITSAMHGAILADSLRVPWFPVKNSALILDFKWEDWAQSMGLNIKLELLPLIKPDYARRYFFNEFFNEKLFQRKLQQIKKRSDYLLSSSSIIEEKKDKLKEVFFRFNTNYSNSR